MMRATRFLGGLTFRPFWLVLAAMGAPFYETSAWAADSPAPRANIVYFLADDLGWGESQ